MSVLYFVSLLTDKPVSVACVAVADWPEDVQVYNINVPIFAGMPDKLPVNDTFVFSRPSSDLYVQNEEGQFQFRGDLSALFAVVSKL